MYNPKYICSVKPNPLLFSLPQKLTLFVRSTKHSSRITIGCRYKKTTPNERNKSRDNELCNETVCKATIYVALMFCLFRKF